jgi:hypothetical protein
VVRVRRVTRLLIIPALALSLGAVPGCAATAPEAPAPAAAAALPPLLAGQQRVELKGLVVTLTMPSAPVSGAAKADLAAGKGHATISLRADNVTDATLETHVFRNVPRLHDSSGATVTVGVQSSWNVVSRVLAGPTATHGAPEIPHGYDGPEGLGAHGAVNGFIVTRFDTTGRGYVVKWDFGSGRVATFKLP